MPIPKISDDDFIHLFETKGPREMSRRTGQTYRGIMQRRNNIELNRRITIKPPKSNNTEVVSLRYEIDDHPERRKLQIKDGVVLVGSDSHYWPGEPSTAHRAFVHFCKKLNPKAVIKNGDEMDGASISRHTPIGWESRPSVVSELETVQERLDEIFKASKNARHIWPLGNHDARFETRLATVAPEYARIHGVHLKDHIPEWEPCWSVWINDDVVIKHRFKGGIHATHNNTVTAGKTMITGHLHSLKVTPYSDYNGTRWGVDCGTMADPFGKQFLGYMEDSPRNWRSGFVVLTFKNGELLWPEVVFVRKEGEVEFRGEVFQV